MLVINGINVFPSQIEHVLSHIEEITLNYQTVANKKGYLDKLEIDIEINENIMSDNIEQMKELKNSIQRSLLNNLYIHVEVRLVPPKSIIRNEGKAIRVIDKRKV